jgi:hypothetical protein
MGNLERKLKNVKGKSEVVCYGTLGEKEEDRPAMENSKEVVLIWEAWKV